VRHAEGASGQESVRTHARLMDDVIFSLTRLIADDADGRDSSRPLWSSPRWVAMARRAPSALEIDLMVVYDGEQSPYCSE